MVRHPGAGENPLMTAFFALNPYFKKSNEVRTSQTIETSKSKNCFNSETVAMMT